MERSGMERTTVRPSWVPVVQLLLMAAWLVGTPLLVFSAAIGSAPFLGEQPTGAEEALSRQQLRAAGALATGAPFAACLLAARYRQQVAATVFGLLAALGLVGAVALSAGGTPAEQAPPPDRPPVCQEHSGGDDRCPGG